MADGVRVSLAVDGANAVVVLDPPTSGPLARLCVAAVVDTSGSMEASCNPKGSELASCFSKARRRALSCRPPAQRCLLCNAWLSARPPAQADVALAYYNVQC